MPTFTSDTLSTSSIGASSDSLPVANAMSHVGVTNSLQTLPTSNPSSVVPLPTVTSFATPSFTPVPAVTNSVSIETLTAWQPPQPSVVAGVDLNQLPPLQRQLFLRIHQQQNDATVNPTSVSSQNPLPLQTTAALCPPPGMTCAVLFFLYPICCILSKFGVIVLHSPFFGMESKSASKHRTTPGIISCYVVACKKLFQNYFSLRWRPSEVILFQPVETCLKLFQIFWRVQCCWNNLKQFQKSLSGWNNFEIISVFYWTCNHHR